MDDMLDKLMGLDKRNEIFNLWYEITFLRFVMVKMMEGNPECTKFLDDEAYAKCRKEAQEVVSKRFPMCKIDFSEPQKEEEIKNEE